MTHANQEPVAALIQGHVLVRDPQTQEVLLDKHNAIHFENFCISVARAMAYQKEGIIMEMVFGNGGSSVSGTGAIEYFPPNISGQNAQLYNETYFKVVNNQQPDTNQPNLNTLENNMVINHVTGTFFSDIVISCTLDYAEPSGQDAYQDSSVTNGVFVFDEIGLKSYDATVDNGLLLSHIIFNPIQKSLNRQIEIVYTIRISAS